MQSSESYPICIYLLGNHVLYMKLATCVFHPCVLVQGWILCSCSSLNLVFAFKSLWGLWLTFPTCAKFCSHLWPTFVTRWLASASMVLLQVLLKKNMSRKLFSLWKSKIPLGQFGQSYILSNLGKLILQNCCIHFLPRLWIFHVIYVYFAELVFL